MELGVLGFEFIDQEGNTVAPHLVGVGWHIDSLLEGEEVGHIVQHASIVLNWVDAEHGGGVEVLADNISDYVARGYRGYVATTIHHVVIVPLDVGTVLFPPASDARDVVAGSGANREVGVVGWGAKTFPVLFGHTLEFKGKDLETLHDDGDGGGNHAKVLATDEHTALVQQGSKVFLGILFPEIVVAIKEEVVGQRFEDPLLVVGQAAIAVGFLEHDAWVPFALFD